jgi:hypothetical protein
MPTVHEIRTALAGGPMRPSEVADALGAEGKERDAVYQAITQLVDKGRGVEKIDDGRVTLIPGWKPSRGPGAGGAKSAKAPATEKRPAKAAPGPITVGGVPVGDAVDPTPQPERPRIDAVVIQRRHLRLLVAHAMAFGEPFEGEMKEAVVTATVLSA